MKERERERDDREIYQIDFEKAVDFLSKLIWKC